MRRQGGGKTTVDRDHEQRVYTHPEHAREILEYLTPHLLVQRIDFGDKVKTLDACCGAGAFGMACREVLYNASHRLATHVTFLDVDPDIIACDASVGSIVKGSVHDLTVATQFDVIVCNPPWRLSEALPIYEKLLTLLAPNGVLFFLINNVFCYQNSARGEQLKFQKYYFLPRWVFKHAGRPLLDCGVLVYHNNNRVPAGAARLSPYIPITRIS